MAKTSKTDLTHYVQYRMEHFIVVIENKNQKQGGVLPLDPKQRYCYLTNND